MVSLIIFVITTKFLEVFDMSIKKIIALVLCLALVLCVFTGCGSKNDDGENIQDFSHLNFDFRMQK